MAENGKPKTKLLDELEKGPWPSFVTEIKKTSDVSPMCDDLLGQLELSYEEKKGHWKHGGIVGVLGYGGGVIGRYSDVPEQFPKVAHFHTMRVNQPSGWFYTSDALRTLCDIWERHGSGLTNMHGSTGDIIFLGTKTDRARADLRRAGRRRLRPGRLRIVHAHAIVLRRPGALRVGLLRHHEDVQRPNAGLPGRAAPPAVPLQVQDQVRRLPERLRGRDGARGPLDHRHLEGRHPAGRRCGRRIRRRRPGYPEGRLRPLPVAMHELGWPEADHRQQRVRALHALHQRHAQGPPARQGTRRGHSDRLQGAHRPGRLALFRAGAVCSRKRSCSKRSRS